MVHDALTFDAAYSAVMETSGAFITDPTPGDYASLAAAALAFATEFDTALNTAGSVGTNTSRGFLAFGICAGVWNKRNILSLANSSVAASYAVVATACAALYTEAVTNLA